MAPLDAGASRVRLRGRIHSSNSLGMGESEGREMHADNLSRRELVMGLGVAALLTACGGLENTPAARAVEPSPNHEYLAVFSRTDSKQPFAVIEKPKDIKIGKGTNVEIDAFTLTVEEIDYNTARGFIQKLDEVDRETRQQLPDGFRVYSDKRFVEPTYSAFSKVYKITFTDPVDAITAGGQRRGGGSGVGGTGGGTK